MLNEVKHLVLRAYGRFLHGTRFFVAPLLRMTLSKNLSFRVSCETQRESQFAGTCHAERSEASRSSNIRTLLAWNEFLRHAAPQNDIKQEPVIASEANQSPSAVDLA